MKKVTLSQLENLTNITADLFGVDKNSATADDFFSTLLNFVGEHEMSVEAPTTEELMRALERECR